MDNKKHKRLPVIEIIMIVMLVIAMIPLDEYWYYVLLDFVICGGCGYLASTAFLSNNLGWAWIFVMTAMLFNPLIEIPLDCSVWTIVDVLTIILLIIYIFTRRKQEEPYIDDDINTHRQCWICGNNFLGAGFPVKIKMYGDAYHKKTSYYLLKNPIGFKTSVINISCCCKECYSECVGKIWVRWIRNTSKYLRTISIGSDSLEKYIGYLGMIIGLIIVIVGAIDDIAIENIDIKGGVRGIIMMMIGILFLIITLIVGWIFISYLTVACLIFICKIFSYLIWILYPIAKIHDNNVKRPKYEFHPEYRNLMVQGYREKLEDVVISPCKEMR